MLAFAVGLHELGRGTLVGARGSAAAVGRPAGGPRGRSRLRVQLPGPRVAGRRRRAVGGDRARDHGQATAGSGAAAALARRSAPAAGVALAAVCVGLGPRARQDDRLRELRDLRPRRARGSATSSTRSRHSRRSGSGPQATSASIRGTAPCLRRASTSASFSASLALAYGLAWWIRRRERAVPAALAVAAALFAYAHFTGTPVSGREIDRDRRAAGDADLGASPDQRPAPRGPRGRSGGDREAPRRDRGRAGPAPGCRPRDAGARLLRGGDGSSLLALANGPVGPATYTPALTELRGRLGHGSTLVLAPERILADEHGRDYLVWELRGGRVCVAPQGPPTQAAPPDGVAHVITQGSTTPPFARPSAGTAGRPLLRLRRGPHPPVGARAR